MNTSTKNKMKKVYRLSFGAGGGLYVLENKKFIDLFHEYNDWKKVISECTHTNILQFNSNLTTNRRVSELCLRLKSFSMEELFFYSNADFEDQAILSWIGLCRTYELIKEFTKKIIIESFLNYKLDLKYADFDFFVEDESQWHPELKNIAEITRKKLRQVLFKMMKEAGFLSSSNQLKPLLPSSNLMSLSGSTKQDILDFIPGGLN